MIHFFLIGAQKSGSTSLYEYFKFHPRVFVPEREDTHYYSYGMGQEIVYERPGLISKAWEHAVKSWDEYESIFSASTDSVAGDCSDSYYFYPGTAERIRADHPDAKIIAVLRHPVARAYSGFNHSRGSGLELETDFSKCMQRSFEEEAGLAPIMRYKSLSMYGALLRPFYNAFGPDKILLVDFADVTSDFSKVAAKICAFLSVPYFQMDRVWANPSLVPPNTGPVAFVYRYARPLRKVVSRINPYSKSHAVLMKLQRSLSRRPQPLDTQIQSNLMLLFRDDIARLTEDFGSGFWNDWR